MCPVGRSAPQYAKFLNVGGFYGFDVPGYGIGPKEVGFARRDLLMGIIRMSYFFRSLEETSVARSRCEIPLIYLSQRKISSANSLCASWSQKCHNVAQYQRLGVRQR